MQLQNLSDATLLVNTKNLVNQERETLAGILHHLREIERRRLFSSEKCASLHEFAVKKLGYSDDQAYRRISAMRLLKDLPQMESRIVDGSLSLSNISLASTVIRAESKASGKAAPVSRKLELMEAVVGKSRREAEVIVQQMTSLPPEILRPESIRQVNEHIEMRLIARKSLEDKITEIKNILAHSDPNLSTSDLFEKLCDGFLERVEAKREGRRQARGEGNRAACASAHQNRGGNADAGVGLQSHLQRDADTDCDREVQPATVVVSPLVRADEPASLAQMPLTNGSTPSNCSSNKFKSESSKRKHISIHVKRQVWFQAENKCQNCGSARALEIDHIKPISIGGDDNLENLRLLCRNCNQRAAIKNLGAEKMERYLP